jgi:peptidoglycan hydrolase CwlO-like protein
MNMKHMRVYEHLENTPPTTSEPSNTSTTADPQLKQLQSALDEINTKINTIQTTIPLVQSNIDNLSTNYNTLTTSTTSLITQFNKIKAGLTKQI